MSYFFTEKSIMEEGTTILYDNTTYKEIGRINPLLHDNFTAIITTGRKKGKQFHSRFKSICEGWIASHFYHKKKKSYAY